MRCMSLKVTNDVSKERYLKMQFVNGGFFLLPLFFGKYRKIISSNPTCLGKSVQFQFQRTVSRWISLERALLVLQDLRKLILT